MGQDRAETAAPARMLLPSLPYAADETTLSYFGRLAAYHTGRGLGWLARDLGLQPMEAVTGQPKAIGILSEVSGTELSLLERGAISFRRTVAQFRGDLFTTAQLSPKVHQYCPDCLLEDGSSTQWRHRIFWSFSAASVCPRHLKALAKAPREAADLREIVDQKTLEVAQRDAPAKPLPEHQRWLHDRLGSAEEEFPWLQGQNIGQVLQASYVLGSVLEHGADVHLPDLSPDQEEAARELGFNVLKHGAMAIHQALDDIVAASPKASPLTRYGTLYQWVARPRYLIEHGPIRDVLREHILKNVAIRAGEVLLGESVETPRFQSVLTMAWQTGLHRTVLARLFRRAGLIPAGLTDRQIGFYPIPADRAGRVVDDKLKGGLRLARATTLS